MLFLYFCAQLFAAELYRFGPDNHMIFVEIQIEKGETPYLFRIDPSLNYSVLTNHISTAYNLKKNSFRGNELVQANILLDNTTLSGKFFLIEGSPTFPLWGGIIGADVLSDVILDINLSKNTLSISSEDENTNTDFFNTKDGILTKLYPSNDSPKNIEITLHFDKTPFGISQSTNSIYDPFSKPRISSYSIKDKPSINDSLQKNNVIGLSSFANARILMNMKTKKLNISAPFTLFPPKRKVYTNELIKRFSKLDTRDKTDNRYILALLYINDQKIDKAMETLTTFLKTKPTHPKAVQTLQELQIKTGTFTYKSLSEEQIRSLIKDGHWNSIINQMWLAGDIKESLIWAQKANKLEPSNVSTWIALSDSLLANRKYQESRMALGMAKTINRTPHAYTLRSALIAGLLDDRESSLSYLRQRLRQPSQSNTEQYVYTRMFSQGSYHEIFEQDIRTIFKNSKSDFMVLSVREIKEQSQAQKLQKKFIQTNCSNLIGDAKTNCIIWLNTLAGEVPTSAIKKMHRIITRNPYRADYWDTLGVLLIERNQRKEAKEAFRTAAIHDPSNPYMLFQYHWFSNK